MIRMLHRRLLYRLPLQSTFLCPGGVRWPLDKPPGMQSGRAGAFPVDVGLCSQTRLDRASMHPRPGWANALQSVTLSVMTAGFSMTLAAYLARLEVLGTRASRTIRAVPSHDRVVVVLDGTLSASVVPCVGLPRAVVLPMTLCSYPVLHSTTRSSPAMLAWARQPHTPDSG